MQPSWAKFAKMRLRIRSDPVRSASTAGLIDFNVRAVTGHPRASNMRRMTIIAIATMLAITPAFAQTSGPAGSGAAPLPAKPVTVAPAGAAPPAHAAPAEAAGAATQPEVRH